MTIATTAFTHCDDGSQAFHIKMKALCAQQTTSSANQQHQAIAIKNTLFSSALLNYPEVGGPEKTRNEPRNYPHIHYLCSKRILRYFYMATWPNRQLRFFDKHGFLMSSWRNFSSIETAMKRIEAKKWAGLRSLTQKSNHMKINFASFFKNDDQGESQSRLI